MIAAEARETEAAVKDLAATIARYTEQGERHSTAIPGLSLFRRSELSGPHVGLYQPSVCLVAQGAKRVQLGEDVFVYDSRRYLLTSVHLPTVVQLVEASQELPYLGLRLVFDPRTVAQLMADSHLPPPRTQQSPRGMATGEVTLPMLSAFQRLVDLLGSDQDIPILAPLLQREIVYRLLVGDLGLRMRQIAAAGTTSHEIAQAVEWLTGNFTEPVRVEDLADRVGMSSSSFHHHFRSMTALSPLQYRKRLRLQEARRLMLAEHVDAASAAYQVGYESPSQFSREYSRLFGAPPARDIHHLRAQVQVGT